MKKILLAVLVGVVVLFGFVLYRLDEMNIKAAEITSIEFAAQHDLAGALYLPEGPGPYKVVVFVHGDGPADRTLDGGYNSIINHLLQAGYACFSYDKAGVSHSSGNWLEQSMADRAAEVVQAIAAIREKVQVEAVGVLAFSQGGWVTSELALSEAPLDFYIVVGGAIDWMEQHLYYETQYAKTAGFSEEETQAYLDYVRQSDSFVAAGDYDSYAKYVQSHDYGPGMSKERFDFAYLNHEANATAGIKQIQVPFLGVFGDSDRNVDVANSMAVYEQLLSENGNKNYELHLVKDATHELLDGKYNDLKDLLLIDAFLYGDGIYADGFLDSLVAWLDKSLA